MNRRKFNVIASLSSLGILKANALKIPLNITHQYNLNYAPHLGMFKALAGNGISNVNVVSEKHVLVPSFLNEEPG